ncbi:MAG TPA: L-threonylcarbamoyladenylate synthase [Burkholderiaceae bacterium]|jgi:L-threonylcarbamoyladenylate synthase|nr:L-threonylcarbamoyladenylate synthase [Burkholderiaceae bacterium]
MAIVSGNDPAALQRAAAELAAGRLVAFPTETVYGLGARADDDAAVAQIFAAKGRPADHPLIVHVRDVAAAQAFAREWPASAQKLADAFWPGPLTVIVPRRDGIGGASAAGQDSIGLRCPSHPAARALLDAAAALGVAGVSGPSANRFGRISPTTAAHVFEEFGDAMTIVDGGECDAGIESAIVDCSRGAPALLRPGVLTRDQIEAALGQPLRAAGRDAPRASGTLEAHYAPRAKLRLMPADQLRVALGVLAKSSVNPVAVYCRTITPDRSVRASRAMPDDPVAAAHELFAALRELDSTGASLIWVETPPDAPAWDGVRDRLQRAAAA